jgi:hypothetical protein
MGKDSSHHWVLIFFVIGASIGYLLGSGAVAPADLLDPVGLVNQIINGVT